MAAGIRVKKFEPIARAAQIRLLGLRIAYKLEDLAKPPGNRLEALKGNRKGQYSIRINDQYRICLTREDAQDGPGVKHAVQKGVGVLALLGGVRPCPLRCERRSPHEVEIADYHS